MELTSRLSRLNKQMLIAPGRAERCASLGMASMLPGKLTMRVLHCDPAIQQEVLFSLAPADCGRVNPSNHLTQSQSSTEEPVGTLSDKEGDGCSPAVRQQCRWVLSYAKFTFIVRSHEREKSILTLLSLRNFFRKCV